MISLSLSDLDVRYFWRWSAFEDYLLFCFGFTLLCAFFTLFFLDWVVFVESLGSLAVLFEAMLGLPQLLQNYNNGSTRGMRSVNPLRSPTISSLQPSAFIPLLSSRQIKKHLSRVLKALAVAHATQFFSDLLINVNGCSNKQHGLGLSLGLHIHCSPYSHI